MINFGRLYIEAGWYAGEPWAIKIEIGWPTLVCVQFGKFVFAIFAMKGI